MNRDQYLMKLAWRKTAEGDADERQPGVTSPAQHAPSGPPIFRLRPENIPVSDYNAMAVHWTLPGIPGRVRLAHLHLPPRHKA